MRTVGRKNEADENTSTDYFLSLELCLTTLLLSDSPRYDWTFFGLRRGHKQVSVIGFDN